MIKTVGIVSLSRGIIGEPFVRHEFDLGVRRLEEMGLKVKFLGRAWWRSTPSAWVPST